MTTTRREHDTPISLLDRLRTARADRDWEILFAVYDGLILSWLQRAGISVEEQEDLKQEILLTLVRAVPSFQHNGHVGAFRKWLKSVVTNRVLHHIRRQQYRQRQTHWSPELDTLNAVEDRMLSKSWEREHDQHVLRQLMRIVEHRFTSTTWMAFQRQFFDQAPAATVSQELGISENAVLIAKSRVLRSLREEAAGIVD